MDSWTTNVRVSTNTGGRRRQWTEEEKLRIVAESLSAVQPPSGRMEIVSANGRRVIVDAGVDTPALGRVLDMLERR